MSDHEETTIDNDCTKDRSQHQYYLTQNIYLLIAIRPIHQKKIRMKKIIGSLALLLYASACSGPSFGDDYVVLIDPKFDEVDRLAITYALDAWIIISDGKLHLTSVIGKPGQCEGDQPGQICLMAASLQEISQYDHGTGDGWLGYCNIDNNGGSHIYMSMSKDIGLSVGQFSIVVQHELGHSFGLSHTGGQYLSIMLPSWTAYGASVAPYVECSDWQQFCDIRSMDSHNKDCPLGGHYVLNGDGSN